MVYFNGINTMTNLNSLTETYSTNILNDMKAIISKYKGKIPDSLIQDMIINSMFECFGIKNDIKTEYQEYYCDLFINYAKNNINPSGFWGEYCIDEGVKEEWLNNHKFKQTLTLIPNITANLINKNISNVTYAANGSNDIKTSTQILLKLIDVVYKTEKDMGILKDRGSENKEAKKRFASSINEDDLQAAQAFLDGE